MQPCDHKDYDGILLCFLRKASERRRKKIRSIEIRFCYSRVRSGSLCFAFPFTRVVPYTRGPLFIQSLFFIFPFKKMHSVRYYPHRLLSASSCPMNETRNTNSFFREEYLCLTAMIERDISEMVFKGVAPSYLCSLIYHSSFTTSTTTPTSTQAFLF